MQLIYYFKKYKLCSPMMMEMVCSGGNTSCTKTK